MAVAYGLPAILSHIMRSLPWGRLGLRIANLHGIIQGIAASILCDFPFVIYQAMEYAISKVYCK